MKGQSKAVQRKRAGPPIKQGFMDDLGGHMHDACTSIAKRAYEIFDHDGRVFGRDLEHWLRAESELFHPLHFVIKESDRTLTIRAEVPGFTAKDLEISVEARRVAISGKRQTKEERIKGTAVYCEQCSDEILRVLDLPADVEPSKTTATLKDGILSLEIPKALFQKTTVEV